MEDLVERIRGASHESRRPLVHDLASKDLQEAIRETRRMIEGTAQRTVRSGFWVFKKEYAEPCYDRRDQIQGVELLGEIGGPAEFDYLTKMYTASTSIKDETWTEWEKYDSQGDREWEYSRRVRETTYPNAPASLRQLLKNITHVSGDYPRYSSDGSSDLERQAHEAFETAIQKLASKSSGMAQTS